MDENTRADVFARVIRVVTEILEVEEVTLTYSTSITKDLKADSVDIVTLLMDLEDEFGGEIPEEDAMKLNTLEDIVDYVLARANEAVD